VEKVDEIFYVFGGTIIGVISLFIGFIINHEREHKKEIRETRSNKGGVGQHDKSGDDVKTTTSTTSTKATQA
jgi:hypothetical protein